MYGRQVQLVLSNSSTRALIGGTAVTKDTRAPIQHSTAALSGPEQTSSVRGRSQPPCSYAAHSRGSGTYSSMLTTHIRRGRACSSAHQSRQRQWGCRTSHLRPRMRPVRADLLDQGDPSDTWERLQLLSQQLDTAVRGEDFKLAATLRDQCKVLKEQLSPVQQYQFYQVQQLKTGTPEERTAAINALRETGSVSTLPHLATALADPGLNGAAEAAMWAIFLRCSQPRAAELLQQGMRFMSNGADLRRALETFDQVIVCEPSFAEGYNKRATVLYLLGRFQESVEECRTVLSLNPYHFGAASGMGLCYMQLRRLPDALAAFEMALAINPGMQQIQQYAELLRQQAGEAVTEE